MKESTANFLLGVLAGAAAGALVGLLFAPDKGSTTREKIKKKIREISDDYDLGIDELINEISPSETSKSERGAKKKRKYTRRAKPATE